MKCFRGLAVLMAVLLSPAMASAQPSPGPSLASARTQYDAGKMDEARLELEALVRGGSQDPQVFLLLGVVERTTGDLTGAIESLRKGRALAPDSVQVGLELATTLSWNRNLDESIALFRQLLVVAPGDISARNGLAFALAWRGQLEVAS